MVRYGDKTNVHKGNLKKKEKYLVNTKKKEKYLVNTKKKEKYLVNTGRPTKQTIHQIKVAHENGKVLANKRKIKEGKKSEFLPR